MAVILFCFFLFRIRLIIAHSRSLYVFQVILRTLNDAKSAFASVEFDKRDVCQFLLLSLFYLLDCDTDCVLVSHFSISQSLFAQVSLITSS